MPTRIHSLETYFYKYIFPIFFIPWDGFRGLRAAFPSITLVPMVLLIILWALLTSVVIWHAVKLKAVVLDGDTLYVKGYLKEVAIRFNNVTKVSRHHFLMGHWAIELRTPTEFGNKIRFIPKRRIVTPAGSKSTFEELQARIARVQA